MTDAMEDLERYIDDRKKTFAEYLSSHAVVGVSDDPRNPYVILTERDPGMSGDVAISELGFASPSPWTAWTRAERVPELMGQLGLRTYYDMKRADGTVRGALRLVKTPIMAARWHVEPASDSTIDKNISDFVEKNLFDELSVPWSRVVEDALLMCEYGFFPFELVFDEVTENGKSRLKLKKLAPRHPMDIQEWRWDTNGGINGIIMESMGLGVPSDYQGIDFNTTYNPQKIFIPIEKLVIFVLEQEAGDLRGISLLRSAYKHYYYKDTLYKIDAIQKERHGIGIPVIKLPMGFSESDKKLADELGRNLRTNERAHVVIPSNWEIDFADIKGQPVNCMQSIEHHDMKIKSNILAPFMDESNVKPDTMDVYYKSTRYIASTVCDTFNHFVIPKLVDFNFSRGKYPKLRVRRIGEWEDIRTMSFAFRNFVGSDAIRPDDELEKYLRTELDLPPVDEKTVRTTPSPHLQTGSNQAVLIDGANPNAPGTAPAKPSKPSPPPVGLPRQTPPPTGTPPKSNAGVDQSGGK